MQNCFRVLPAQTGRSQELILLLEKAVEDHAGVQCDPGLANLVEARDGLNQARALVLRQLRRHPSMKGFTNWWLPSWRKRRGGPARRALGVAAATGGRADQDKNRPTNAASAASPPFAVLAGAPPAGSGAP